MILHGSAPPCDAPSKFDGHGEHRRPIVNRAIDGDHARLHFRPSGMLPEGSGWEGLFELLRSVDHGSPCTAGSRSMPHLEQVSPFFPVTSGCMGQA